MVKRNIIITKVLGAAFVIAALLTAPGAALLAHGGFDHVIGTVAGVSGNVLTVKTAKGNVDVKLDDKTEISKGEAKAQAADLKAGLRVVVDIPEGSKDKIAHSVKIGATAPAHDHDAH
ncbi:MAG TPA: hypothetical protein VHY84_07725 [Bryobacteraceae bacterium]|jgi:hypothetical protein|nr:hypothetical protein [Bryobacteraceae bacterium]